MSFYFYVHFVVDTDVKLGLMVNDCHTNTLPTGCELPTQDSADGHYTLWKTVM